MKLLLQISLFLLTWFLPSATPAFSKVALPNYAVFFPKTTNPNLESERKIGVSNFARSGILENSFSQKAVLWESSVLENRARKGNVNVVSGAGSVSKYTKVDGWLKGITNATSKANVENIIKSWSDNILTSLNSKLDLFPGLQAEFVANNQLLHHFNSIETTWWSKYALGGLAKRTNSTLPVTFKQMVGEIEVTSLGQKLKLKTVSLDETSASYIGKLFDETVETRMVNAWKTNNFSDLPSSVSTQLQTLKNQGYELAVEAKLTINGKNPVPDYLLVKKEIDPLTNVITYDANNVKYIDCKYLWDSPFTTSQAEIVNGVRNSGVANTIAPLGIKNVNGVEIILPNTSVKINSVEKLTVNQQIEMVIQ